MAVITILRPPLLVPTWSDSGPLTPPIGPAYLAASLRAAGHDPRIVDALGEDPFRITPLFDGTVTAIGLDIDSIVDRIDPRSDLIGVSCMFSQDWPVVRKLIHAVHARFPDIPIVAGGEHVNAVGTYTFESTPEVLACVLGEGEETVVELAEWAEGKRTLESIAGLLLPGPDGGRRTGPRARIQSVDEIPLPAWDLVPLANYLDNGLSYGVDRGRSMPMLATRGCPYQCTFCSNPEMWTTRWYPRDPGLVLDEMAMYQEKYGATNFDFYDLTAIVKKTWIIDFTNLITERGLVFTWQLPSGTRSEAIDEEVSASLYRAGCRNMSYAPESGSPAVLERIKKVVKLDRLETSVRGAVHNGLNVKLNIIMGFPDETRQELGQTVRFLARMAMAGVHDMSISLFTPYPGCALYDELVAAGKLPPPSDEFFLGLGAYKDFSQTVSYTDAVSPRTLNAYRIAGFVTFYGLQYLRRPWRFVRLLANLASNRQESRLDKSLQDLKYRIRNRRRTGQARQGGSPA